jgi:hypothetical protein
MPLYGTGNLSNSHETQFTHRVAARPGAGRWRADLCTCRRIVDAGRPGPESPHAHANSNSRADFYTAAGNQHAASHANPTAHQHPGSAYPHAAGSHANDDTTRYANADAHSGADDADAYAQTANGHARAADSHADAHTGALGWRREPASNSHSDSDTRARATAQSRVRARAPAAASPRRACPRGS